MQALKLIHQFYEQNNSLAEECRHVTGPDPGFPVGGGVDPFWRGFGLRRRHFSLKMYAKTKELGLVGGVRRHAP